MGRQLRLYEALGFGSEATERALELLSRDERRVAPPFTPRQVLLFSGHLVDAPDRAKPRFPASKGFAAGEAIGQAL
jgi:hypothetical protein